MNEEISQNDPDVTEGVDDAIELDEDSRSEEDLLNELKRRCGNVKIEISTRKFDESEGVTYTSIAIQSGREKRWVGATGDRLRGILSIDFEKIVFLKGYEAICSYEKGTIEVGIRGVPFSHMLAMRRLLLGTGGSGEESEFVLLPPDGIENRPTYRIGGASAEFSALAQLPGGVRRPTLTLSGIPILNHDNAVSLLTKYANSFLFQIDLLFGASFMLERERVRRFRQPSRNRNAGMQYPNVEYDDAPLSLYWYARSARGMPLLQFLAFYQCIEFYYPTFSQAEARRKIGLLLKDPTFRPDRDSDVARLLSAIFVSRSGGVGDERSQLRATIGECLTAEEVRDFFNQSKDLDEFFRGKQKGGVHKIPLANESADLRNDVADRIYNIRCRIVHTKDGDQHGGNMILPFSEDADFLIFDIELVQFVARKVLIATSTIFG